MDTLSSAFADTIKKVMGLSNSPDTVTGDNVYQEANERILAYIDKVVEGCLLPGSGLNGFENLEELFAKAESGKSCLILPEHYSNMDLPIFSYLLRKAGGRGEDIARSVIAIAGMKLNEDNPAISALASAYTRIVIYPSRSLQEKTKDKEEEARGNAINRAAMKELADKKTQGRIILIFPSGTRYRPWDPSTKRGRREVYSYIRSFDYMCLLAINGLILRVREGEMLDDEVANDVMHVTASPVIPCADFLEQVKTDMSARGKEGKDRKQALADAIMAELEKMHIVGEENRKQFIK